MTIELGTIKDYAGPVAAGYSDETIAEALAAETAAQARACVIPEDDMPADLTEALKRRVVRNLAMRSVPLGVQADESGGIRLGSRDPEIIRLEGPHRRRSGLIG